LEELVQMRQDGCRVAQVGHLERARPPEEVLVAAQALLARGLRYPGPLQHRRRLGALVAQLEAAPGRRVPQETRRRRALADGLEAEAAESGRLRGRRVEQDVEHVRRGIAQEVEIVG